MDSSLNKLLWQQAGAAVDMLENAITACPDECWNTESKFWYTAYHTIFFFNYYLSDTPMEKYYVPPPPFTLSEFGEDMPERVYHKSELLAFLDAGRQKCREMLKTTSADDLLQKRFVSEYKDFTLFELLIYNVRHVQHHTGQLNLLLRQHRDTPPNWVSRTKTDF